LQSVITRQPPYFHRWHDEARSDRAFRDYVAGRVRALYQVARRAPRRRPWLDWCYARSALLTRLGLLAIILFYAATAAYGVSLTGRWAEVNRTAVAMGNGAAVAVGLGIAKVSIEGRNHVSEAEIAKALGVHVGVSIFAFDTAAARDRLLENGWIREARVMRLLPSTLVVELEERAPYAIWRDGGESAVVDISGRVLAEVAPASFPTLPTVSGPGAAIPAKEIVEMVRSFPELAARARDMERIAGRRWDLLLDSGLRAKLPALGLKAALADLNDIIARNPAALYEVSEIDLRVASQFTLRLKDSSDEGRKKFMSWFIKPRRESAL
jgi:cell division protein FtsQ